MKPEERKVMLEAAVGDRDDTRVLEKTSSRLAKYLADFKRRIEQDSNDPRAYLQAISYMADKIHFCADALLTEQNCRMESRSRWRRRS